MRRVLLLAVLLVLLPAVPAGAASVQIEPGRGSIELGEDVRLALESEGDAEAQIQLQASPFPYKEFVDEGQPLPLSTKSVSVRPRRNTRYRAVLFLNEEKVATSKPRIVFVQPRSKLVSRWNRPYLFARGWTEIDEYYRPLYKKLPARQKSIYLYTRCGGGPWRFGGQSPLRAVSLRDNFRFDWSISRALPCRATLQYWNVGMLLFPGTLPSGDEGLGRPVLSRSEIKEAVSLLGARTISTRDMKRFFGS